MTDKKKAFLGLTTPVASTPPVEKQPEPVVTDEVAAEEAVVSPPPKPKSKAKDKPKPSRRIPRG